MNFVTDNLNVFFPCTQNFFLKSSFVLPIGISFFTFQAISYIIDVYRGLPAQKNLLSLGLYISFFPQLIAGPIVRYNTIMNLIEYREISFSTFVEGFKRFLLGFNKKMLLANLLAEVADFAFGSVNISVLMAWLGAVCYSLQIFFDFSGYSDMAIGLGRMFGFTFLENFNYPYVSKSCSEFWRRWHISLGSYFRDYIYLPLGGSKVSSKFRITLNLFAVWIATGVWHGANWTFILWGIMHGIMVVFEKITNLPHKILNYGFWVELVYRIFVLLIIVCGWVVFRAENLPNAWKYLSIMFGFGGAPVFDARGIFFIREYIIIIIIGILCSVPISDFVFKYLLSTNKKMDIGIFMKDVLYVFLFFIGISMLVIKTHNPFIYFNF